MGRRVAVQEFNCTHRQYPIAIAGHPGVLVERFQTMELLNFHTRQDSEYIPFSYIAGCTHTIHCRLHVKCRYLAPPPLALLHGDGYGRTAPTDGLLQSTFQQRSVVQKSGTR